MELLENLIHQTAFFNGTLDWRNYVMILVAFLFLYLAIKKGYEPLLLVPIAFGMLLVNIYPAIFDFVLIDGRDIVLFNTFSYKSVADFNYFFLNAVDNLKLPPLTIPVSVCGMLSSDNQIMESMKKYIKNISYFVRPSHFEYAYGFNEVPSHYFTNMIILYQCG